MIPRVLVYDRADTPRFEVPSDSISALVRYEELGGERYLDITTCQILDRDDRILLKDANGRWHEYVVEGIDQAHAAGYAPEGTYHCPWSMQHDLALTTVSSIPTNASTLQALEAALAGTSRWVPGTVGTSVTATASMYDMSGWEAIGVLCETWGCEVDDEITVDNVGVVSRACAALAQVGDPTPSRRFDYGFNVKGIRRTVDETPVYARIIPKGMGEETETGFYGRRIGIEGVNSGVPWLQNDETADALRVPDGSGGWEYPTAYVVNSECETPADLKAWALSVLDDYTVPKVTYSADVALFNAHGTVDSGVKLGDAVQVVDTSFYAGGLRFQTRVAALRVNELNPSDVALTLGEVSGTLASGLTELGASLERLRQLAMTINGGTASTDAYLSRLVTRLDYALTDSGGLATGADLKMLYGTCATSAATTAKVVTLTSGAIPNDAPTIGMVLAVTFTNGNSAAAPALRIGSTGTARNISISGTVASTANKIRWTAGMTLRFMWNGNYWDYIDDRTGVYETTCATAAATKAKAATLASAVLCRGARVKVGFTYTNTHAAPSLSLTTQGTFAGEMHIDGQAWSALYNWAAGDAVTFEFDGSAYNVVIDGAGVVPLIKGLASLITSDSSGNIMVTGANATLDATGNAWFAGDVEAGGYHVAKSGNLTSNTTPNATTGGKGLSMQDSNGYDVAIVRPHFTAAGNQGVQLYAQRVVNGTTHWNILRLGIDSSGNSTVDLTAEDKAAWLTALGLGSVTEVTTVSQIVTAGSGVTITVAQFASWGKVAQLYIAWTYSSAITVPANGNISNITVGTIVAGKRPAIDSFGISDGDGAGQAWYGVNSSGVIYLGACEGTGASRTIAAGTTFRLRTTFLLA